MNSPIVHPVTGEISDTALALDLPENLSDDEWVQIGEQLCAGSKVINWWIGDWWAFGSHKYGERAKLAAQGIFGREFQSLKDIGYVSRSFEASRRRDLSFTHHREVASLPADQADRLLVAAEAEGWSVREIRQAAKQTKPIVGLAPSHDTCTVEDLAALGTEKKYGCIYADPPWVYDNQGTRAATGNHYNGLTVDELCELPIGDLVADDAHLHMWTTNAFLFECPRIFEAWGFEYRSTLVWVKPQMGIGNYWRNSHEYLMTAIRGDAKRFNDKSLMSWMECDRGAHSAKPERVRHMVEKASHGPYLELFGRMPAPGWTVWGNQIKRDLMHFDVDEIAA